MHVRDIARVMAGLLLSALVGCGGAHIPRPPAPEDSVARLQRNIAKVRHAIESTQQLIGRARGQPYLPDLYLRLAELYVEEAKYHYFIAYEGTKRRERAVTSVQARLLKDQAIAVYNRIMREFPDFREADKVLFSIAHEQRELGTYDEMLRTLQRIVDDFPKSAYRNESLLVIGDYHFDKNELPEAERFYRLILASPESTSHGMARYKLAWVRMNKEDFKGALQGRGPALRPRCGLRRPRAAGRLPFRAARGGLGHPRPGFCGSPGSCRGAVFCSRGPQHV